MFPSSPNCFESLLKRSDQNPTCTFNFPSPFLDEHESPLNQIFLQTPHRSINHAPLPLIDLATSKIEEQTADQAIPPLRRRSLGVIPRRRTGKKDRHSKICTAQGIRDRRMRLSLQVARKFFDLQDMLGYDKASKTIEWLFTQSKKAIKDLVDDHQSPAKSESFLSECEELSGIEEINSNAAAAPLDETSNAAAVVNPTEASTKPPSSCKRESRERARERARCRTREKMLVKCLQISGENCFKPNPSNDDSDHNVGKLGPFDEANIPNIHETRVYPFYNTIEEQLSDVGTIEKFLENSSSNYHCAAAVSDYADPNSFMGFLGNWDHVLSSASDKTNCLQFSNPVSFAAGNNLNSVFSATAEFP